MTYQAEWLIERRSDGSWDLLPNISFSDRMLPSANSPSAKQDTGSEEGEEGGNNSLHWQEKML